MTVRAALTGSQAQVEAWSRRLAPLADGPLPVMHIPHLSTACFDAYVVGQPAIGPAGDLFVLSDGQIMLAGGAADFCAVLRREAFFEKPDGMAPALFGNLFARIVIGQRLGVIEAADDYALGKLPPSTRAAFQPPQSRRESDAVVVSFWTSGPAPFDVRRWEVRVSAGYTLAHAVWSLE